MDKKQSNKNLQAEYSAQTKAFLNSDAWREFVLPAMQSVMQSEFPKPNQPNWQEKYIYAFALAETFTFIINTLGNLSSREDFEKRVEKFLNQAVDEA